MKIFFVADKLEIGGTERSISNLCNYWSNNGYEVNLIVIYSGKGRNDYFLDKRIKLIYLADIIGTKKRSFISSIKRLIMLRRILINIKPDIIISFLTHVNVVSIIFSFGLKIPIFISERNYPPMKKTPMLWKFLRKFIYRFADCVIVQTNITKIWIDKNITVKKSFVIPNPCLYPLPETIPKLEKNNIFKKNIKSIIAVGRFDEQKGFINLINVFLKISKKMDNWNLIIMGDGNERKKYEQIVKNNHLENRIFLPGRAGNISEFYDHADIFVLSSLYEGFPNVLLEAMSHGLPVISMNCKTGPSDIIENNINGLLVSMKNIENDFYYKLIMLMKDGNLRKKFAIESVKVIENYSINKIGKKWENLFNKYC